jgi:hypothetical protein
MNDEERSAVIASRTERFNFFLFSLQSENPNRKHQVEFFFHVLTDVPHTVDHVPCRNNL